MFKRITIMIAACTGLICMSFTAAAQDMVSILFDGGEAGIADGTTDFSFMGSNWTGGFVANLGDTTLYASGSFSYHVEPGPGSVTFDMPMETVTMFYIHGGGISAGTATATLDTVEVDSASSNVATSFGDAANFVTLTSEEGIDRIDFTTGIVDNFTYTELAVAPPPSASNVLIVEGSVFAEEGGTITLSANEDMDPPYQWMKDDVDMGGETNASFAIMGTTTFDSGVYELQYDDGEKATALSDPVALTIFPSGALPATGLIGLALLAATSLLGGAVTLCKQKM